MYDKCMTMQQVPVRLSKQMVEHIDELVVSGQYTDRSDVMRAALRSLVVDRITGISPNTGDSVKELREIRKKLSKEPFNIDEINSL